MIAVTGANGQLGRLVIKSLLTKTDANNIVALVRSPDNAEDLKKLGIEVRKADYNDPVTLGPALQGIDKLLLISSSEIGQRAAQHQAVIDAAKKAEIKLFAYTSLLKADTSPLALAQEHKVTEQAITSAGLPAVILRNGWYTENYTGSLDAVLNAGSIVGAAENGKLHTASRQDYAEAAAIVLTSDENQVGKVYELAGDQGFTLEQYATEISKQANQQIQYQALTGSEYAELLTNVGLPEAMASLLADAEVNAAKGWLAEDSQTLSQLIGRPTTSLAESISLAL